MWCWKESEEYCVDEAEAIQIEVRQVRGYEVVDFGEKMYQDTIVQEARSR